MGDQHQLNPASTTPAVGRRSPSSEHTPPRGPHNCGPPPSQAKCTSQPKTAVMSTASDNPTPITIRQAQVEDAPNMGRMMVTTWLTAHRGHIPRSAWERRQQQWTPRHSADGWEHHLRVRDASPDQARSCYLIAEDNQGTLIAIAAAAAVQSDPRGHIAEVGSLYVHPDHQRRGLGRRMVQQLAACLADMGFESLHIGVLAVNLDARQFYEALGGQPAGERLFDEDGDLLLEYIYAWPNLTSLIKDSTSVASRALADIERSARTNEVREGS